MTRRWVAACAVGEAVGMTAAAGAARVATQLAELNGSGVVWGFIVVVLGGLVEGTALGVLQAMSLPGRMAGGRTARRWALVTVAVAGVGWAAGSAPATLSGHNTAASPSLLVIAGAAAVLGLAIGGLLGAAQAWAVRDVAGHPWRWVLGSACGWAGAMPVIFLGATVAGERWPWPAVVGLGTATGLGAGAVLGLLSGPFLAALDGPPVRHRVVVWILGSRLHGVLPHGLAALEVTGAASGRRYRFPVQAATTDAGALVVLPGHSERKRWWRNLTTHPCVQVLRDGRWQKATAEIVSSPTPAWSQARASYQRAYPGVTVSAIDPLVVLRAARIVPAAPGGVLTGTEPR